MRATSQMTRSAAPHGEPSPRSAGELTDRVAVVTGAGQGIGAAIAHALAGAGAAVVVTDRDARRAEDTAAAIADLGHTSSWLAADVADEGSVEAMASVTVERHGRVDVLVNNAAMFSGITMKPFEDISAAEWRAVVDVNLTGVFLCARAVAPRMRAQRSGVILNLSSSTVLSGRPFYAHYVASKAGVVGLTRCLARELGDADVRVNALMPGSVDTGIPRDSIQPGQAEQIVGRQALHHRLQPHDIAAAAVFLASDAARLITGQTIVVDGGMDFR